MADFAHCRSCDAKIIWTVTHNGKRMPVDATPRSDGNICLRTESDGIVIAEYPGREAPALFENGRWRYVSHFATCPNAKSHRKVEA